MHNTPRLLDIVALLSHVPAHGLLRGQVGTVVELLDRAYEVEFSAVGSGNCGASIPEILITSPSSDLAS